MTGPHWVLDSGALMAYSHAADAVGQILVDVADAETHVAVPFICAVEAYSLLHHTEHEMLRMLLRNPAVRLALPANAAAQVDDCPTIGAMARQAGRLGAGHAAYVALVNAAGIATSRPDQIQSVLGEGWQILEV